jgi:hypothetical protein
MEAAAGSVKLRSMAKVVAKFVSAHPVRPLSKKDAPIAQRLREVCLEFPEANERTSHGEPTWFAGKGKVFAMLDNHHHGSPFLSVWLPMPLGVQQALIDSDAARFFSPPYVGVKGWVGVRLDGLRDWKRLQLLVRDAYMHIATKTLQKLLLSAAE